MGDIESVAIQRPPFLRDKMVLMSPSDVSRTKGEWKVEGFWKSLEKSSNSKDDCNYPVPVANLIKWSMQDEWCRKLELIEKFILHTCDSSSISSYLGYASCRFASENTVPKSTLCNDSDAEFYFSGICWPAGFRKHDVLIHNVCPSKEFYNFVDRIYSEISTSKNFTIILNDYRSVENLLNQRVLNEMYQASRQTIIQNINLGIGWE